MGPDWRLREAKVIRKERGWFIHIEVEKEVEIKREYRSVIAIDLGSRWVATLVSAADTRPKFHCKELRRVRGHYFYLRRRLAKLRKYKAIKKLGNKESRIANDILHKISREIVEKAKRESALIVLGKLKGVIEKNGGREANRRVHTMPHYKLTKFIEYKASWDGIPVMKISEEWTSKICSRCGSRGSRYNGRFRCKCGELNADLNGARNILK